MSELGLFEEPLSGFGDLLAACAAFQAFVGAGTVGAARARVFELAVTGAEMAEPYALITPGEEWRWRNEALVGPVIQETPVVVLELGRPTESGVTGWSDKTDRAALSELLVEVRAILRDAYQQQGQGGFPIVREVVLRDMLRSAREAVDYDRLMIELAVQLGEYRESFT